ncbi:MAG: hypothetical protein JST40_04145 [Armatimonadetes bacterium]|nr:hypothetical protein [Armatimonadota bacterium]
MVLWIKELHSGERLGRGDVQTYMETSRHFFINLPSNNLASSRNFLISLGFTERAEFSSEFSVCVQLAENLLALYLTPDMFRQFAPHPVGDSSLTTACIVSIPCNTKEEVDEMVRRASSAGGQTFGEPKTMESMYVHSVTDPDHHTWEFYYAEITK